LRPLLRDSMKVNYHTKIEQRRLGDKLYVMEVIRDLDEAIDQVCSGLTPAEQNDPFAEDLCPYFGILWPAAEGLAIFINNHPDLVRHKRVLELGCGLGFPSLVAGHFKANVLATDFHPDAEEYFKRNCRHSVIDGQYQRLNWREDKEEIGLFDVVMGSDILYESKHPAEVAQGLIRFLSPGGKIMLSDPGRNYLQPFLKAMNNEGYTDELHSIGVDAKEVLVIIFSKN
jgi:predicted nicotinamide N-methyase